MMKKLLCTLLFSIFTFSIVTAQADIEITGNGTVIIDGQTTISTADDTDFGATPLGTPVIHQFTINNTGTSDLFISLPPSLNDLGTGTSDWSTTSPAFQIPASGSSTFDITFNPSVSGIQSVELSVTSSDADESPYTFNLQGEGIAPTMIITGNGQPIANGDITPDISDDTDFGSTSIGTPVTHQFTINNNGASDLFISLPPSIGDLGTGTSDWSATNPSFQIPASGSSTFDITFNPSTAGSQSVEISITSSDPSDSPYTFVVSGAATVPAGPDIEITGNGTIIVDGQTTISSTDDTDFGSTPIGTPVTHQFTINNTGTTDLFISLPPSINDLGTGTSDWSTTSPSFQVPASGFSTFDITFNPTIVGSQSVEISITSNDSDESPYTFVVGGTATLPVGPDIEISGNGTIIVDGQTAINIADDTDFGSTALGTPVTHQFTVTNTGNADLFISLPPGINDLGTGISDWSTSNPSFQIPALSSSTFDITFNPSTAGAQSVEISITSNDLDENPYTFVVGGLGVLFEPEIDIFDDASQPVASGATVNLGQTDVTFGTIVYTFTIENNGAADLILDGTPIVNVSGPNSADFTITSLPSTLVSPSGSTTFEITFDPSALGTRVASISIENNDSDEDPYEIIVQGEGIDTNSGTPLLITQYYEGSGSNQWIEVKNISQQTVIAGSYFLALYTNFNTLTGTINTTAPNQSVTIGTMTPGAVRVFRNPAASLPGAGNLGSAPVTDTNVCTFDGNDVILISTTNGVNCYDNRIDIMGVVDAVTPRTWGQDVAYIKGCGTNEQPSTTFDVTLNEPSPGDVLVNDYIELTLDEVNNADPATNIALGTQGVGPTIWTTSWDNETPDRTRNTVINGTYIASDGSFETCNFTVNGTLNFNSSTSNYISVHEDMTINGTFTIGDTESLHFGQDNEDAVINGVVTKIESSTSLVNINDFTYWSSPVVGATVEGVFSNADLNRVYYWDQSAENLIPGGDVGDPTIVFGEWINASGTMRVAKGYISEGPTTGAYPQQHTISFTGVPHNGVLSIAGSPHMVFNNDGNAYSDYNLVGNPYPSAIDADLLIGLTDNNTIDGTLWFWTHNTQNNGNEIYQYTTDDYASYNLTGGTAAATGGATPTNNVGSGQGFMVRAISPSPGLIFNNEMRLRDQNTQFFRGIETKNTKAGTEKDRVWLNVESSEGGAFNQILIGFMAAATDGHDRGYDGLKNGASWISFYSKIDSTRYAIQGLSSFSLDKKVKLGFDTYIDKPLAYTISIANIEGVLKENELYLVDHMLGVTHDLKQAPYSFDTDGIGYFDGRFTLQFTKSTLSIDELNLSENEFVIVNKENSLTIKSNTIITKLKVYDMMGRLLLDKKPNDSNFEVPTPNIRKGTVLILNATFENGAEASRKAIKY